MVRAPTRLSSAWGPAGGCSEQQRPHRASRIINVARPSAELHLADGRWPMACAEGLPRLGGALRKSTAGTGLLLSVVVALRSSRYVFSLQEARRS
jgi:hypothetical protein